MFRKRSIKGDPHVEFQCTVRFLDEAEPIQVTFKKDTLGQTVFDQVCFKLNLVEKDYFGLRYVDGEKQRHWLDPLKTVHKQLKGVNPCALCFRVKFYPSDPTKLHEEITRYYMFLQLRRDLHHGRLLCSPADANLLAAYIIQSEVGDYDEADHPPGYVSEFKMLPKQNAKMEEQIMELHKTLSGQNPAEAEANFLKKAATLDTYGVDPHQVKEQKGTSVFLGVTHQGIMTFHGSRRTQLFKWSQIKKMPTYEGKMFIVHVNIGEDEDQNNAKKKLQPMGYKCSTVAACKYLWKCAVEQQLFFTLASSDKPPKVRSGGGIFSRGSKFRFSGRCQNEAFCAGEEIKRDEPNFNRTSSLPNYGRKTESRAAKVKSLTLDVSIKEDKKKKPVYNESAVDVPGTDSKIAVEVVSAGPVVKAPVAKPEDATIEDEERQPEESVKSENTPKLNGSIPAIVLEPASDELPPYEPNQTIIDESQLQDEVEVNEIEEFTKPSLEDQIKDLEEEFERKGSFTQPNHVDEDKEEEVIVSETIQPVKSNHVMSSPANQINASTTAADTKLEPAPSKSNKVSCCKVILYTFIFIFLTLAVVIVVLMNSNIKHPLMTQFREHLQFVNPVRDYINHQMKALFKS